jgi:hypothetical protein
MTPGRTFPISLVLTAACSLHGADGYLIAGVVVDAQSHRPLANVRVLLGPTATGSQKIEQVAKDGRFSFGVSSAGKYRLQIAKPGYPIQSYRQVDLTGVSSAIVVRDDQDTSHLVFEAVREGAITVQVKDEDSDPVGNALVSIFQSSIVSGERRVIMRAQVRANAAGVFRFANLARGNYYVCAMGRPWFADSILQFQQMEESLNGRAARLPARTASVGPGGGDPDLDAGVEPAASIPKFSPDPNLRGTAFQTTFYPRAQTVEEASLVPVEAGGEAQVSITLPLTRGVSVKGAISGARDMSDGRANLDKKVRDQYVLFLQEWVAKDGIFQFKNVPPGYYEIVAASQSSSGASSWNLRQEVLVGTSDMEVTLRPQAMGAVAGRVLFEREGPAPASTLFVSLRSERNNLYRGQVDAEGNFSLNRLPVGRYDVTASGADYLATYLSGPSGEHLPLTLEITSGETTHRDLMLTRAVSAIEGTVEKAGMPSVGALVLLMPKNPSERWAYRVDQTDSDGSYRLATIPSGDYFLIALSEGSDPAYRNAKVAAILAKEAKLIHVEAGDRLDVKLDVVDSATLNLPPL